MKRVRNWSVAYGPIKCSWKVFIVRELAVWTCFMNTNLNHRDAFRRPTELGWPPLHLKRFTFNKKQLPDRIRKVLMSFHGVIKQIWCFFVACLTFSLAGSGLMYGLSMHVSLEILAALGERDVYDVWWKSLAVRSLSVDTNASQPKAECSSWQQQQWQPLRKCAPWTAASPTHTFLFEIFHLQSVAVVIHDYWYPAFLFSFPRLPCLRFSTAVCYP